MLEWGVANTILNRNMTQDFRLHIYDTTSPPLMNGNEVEAHSDGDHETTMKTLKTIQGTTGNWTITDSHLSPDNERMIYSSIVRIHSHQLPRRVIDLCIAQDPGRSHDADQRRDKQANPHSSK